MKKSRIFSLLLVLVLALSISAIPASAAKDDVVFNFTSAATSKNSKGECGFFGPYIGNKEMATLTSADGFVIDLSVSKAWAKFEISPQTTGMKKYAVLKIKTDDVTASKGFNVTIGGATVAWDMLKTSDGKAAPELTTVYQAVCIDIAQSFNVDSIVAKGKADVGIAQGNATGGKVYIQSITFTDEAAASATETTSVAPSTKKDEPTTKKNDNSTAATSGVGTKTQPSTKKQQPADVPTGVTNVILPSMAVAGAALALLAVTKKKSK